MLFRAERFRRLARYGFGSTMPYVFAVDAARCHPRVVPVWSRDQGPAAGCRIRSRERPAACHSLKKRSASPVWGIPEGFAW
jgi:hypothetical protein